MKGIIRKSSIALLAASLLLTGCGESIKALTAEEENLVVAYSSAAIGKANKKQAKGLLYVVPKSPEEEMPQEKLPGQQEPAQNGDQGNSKIQQGKENGVQAGSQGAGNEGQAGSEGSVAPARISATLTDALGMSPITAEYNGYQLQEHYVQGDYFSLDAKQGNQYLIINITLTNPGDQPAALNILERKPVCSMVVNGVVKGLAIMTPLVNDFATYMETVEAGSSVDTILIFELKAEDAADIQSLSMNFSIHGNDYNINLE